MTGRVRARVIVPGRVAEAESLWYDPGRWPAWVDGFGHVAKLEGAWPAVGARLVWDSPPLGRGLVAETVTAYEVRAGQTVAVEDGRLHGTRSVAFVPDGGAVRVTVELEYRLKERGPFTWLVDPLFIRRALRDSLTRTLTRFARERGAEHAG